MQYAARAAVEAAIQDWTDAVLACRLRGHPWPIGKAVRGVPTAGGWVCTEWCPRKCGVHRWYFMNHSGFVPDRPHLVYPKDTDGVELYLMKGLGRVDASGMAAIRLAALRNMTVVEE